jgi:hypothetical protein
MKRVVSYSDSFIILGKQSYDGLLTPILIPREQEEDQNTGEIILYDGPKLKNTGSIQQNLNSAGNLNDSENSENSENSGNSGNSVNSEKLKIKNSGDLENSVEPPNSQKIKFSNSGKLINFQPFLKKTHETHVPSRSFSVLCFLFTFKGSFHLLLISAFETIFYFIYVNKQEDSGIKSTIDAYYLPLITNCQNTWSNSTRWIFQEILKYEINQTQIDAAGNAAATWRNEYNNKLLLYSIMYSVFCLAVFLSTTLFVFCKRWIIPWKRMFAENLIFVCILGIYEFFFFKTIVYNYVTFSKDELNQYIVDGLVGCAALTNEHFEPYQLMQSKL